MLVFMFTCQLRAHLFLKQEPLPKIFVQPLIPSSYSMPSGHFQSQKRKTKRKDSNLTKRAGSLSPVAFLPSVTPLPLPAGACRIFVMCLRGQWPEMTLSSTFPLLTRRALGFYPVIFLQPGKRHNPLLIIYLHIKVRRVVNHCSVWG